MTEQLELLKTPIVYIHHSKTWTTSLWVSKEFDRRHNDVLRDIRKLKCSSDFRLRNFAQSSYINEQQKQQPMYEMSFNGFMFLIMGYHGEKAAMVKEAYIKEFDRRGAALVRQKQLDWQEAREQTKQPRLFEADAIAQFVDYAKAHGSEHAEQYYTNITRETYRALFDVDPREMKRLRSLLTMEQLAMLQTAELIVKTELVEGMARGLPYKGTGSIFEITMQKVRLFGQLIGKTPVPMMETNRMLN